jgi:hypothetical protein
MIETGAKGFDFYHGQWALHNRKLRDVFDRDCTEWVSFDGHVDCQPIFSGTGNIEFATNDAAVPFEGLTVRLFEPDTGIWRLYWASTRQPGELGLLGAGRFDPETGSASFYSDEVVDGRTIGVRVVWSGIEAGTPHWEQSFSYDEGKTWETNWVIDSTRD